jgi:hypothetical protein
VGQRERHAIPQHLAGEDEVQGAGSHPLSPVTTAWCLKDSTRWTHCYSLRKDSDHLIIPVTLRAFTRRFYPK